MPWWWKIRVLGMASWSTWFYAHVLDLNVPATKEAVESMTRVVIDRNDIIAGEIVLACTWTMSPLSGSPWIYNEIIFSCLCDDHVDSSDTIAILWTKHLLKRTANIPIWFRSNNNQRTTAASQNHQMITLPSENRQCLSYIWHRKHNLITLAF